MTNVDALKKLYIELGGNEEDIANIETSADMIEVLADIAGSTIELPGVTSEDNGDVLTVVEGEWAKATIPRQSVILTCTSPQANKYKIPITPNELKALIDAGINVILKCPFTVGSTNFYRFFYLMSGSNNTGYRFVAKYMANYEPVTISILELNYANNDIDTLVSHDLIGATV